MEEKHKPMDFELCDYDEGFSRLEASDIGWCGTCKIPDCPYNKKFRRKTKIRVQIDPMKEAFLWEVYKYYG